MKKIQINLADITDWNSFHNVFSLAFSFPNYYGGNLDAWIDCMDDYCDENELVLLELSNKKFLEKSNKKILNALLECSAFVNFRRIERGDKAVLIVSMN